MFHSFAARSWLVALLALVVGCGRVESQRAEKKAAAEDAGAQIDPTLPLVTLQLNWFPEVEHGGYYAALVHGYYQEAGLNVKILPGGPDTPVVQQVARRAVTFGVVNADNVLFGRAQQVPIVALMAPLQISPRCLIVHESSGIQSFDDLKNMTIAMSSSSAFTQFLQKTLPLPGVQVVPYTGTVAIFLRRKDYAQQGYVFSEPFVARKEGGDPKVLMVSSLGFNPYTSCLFTHDDQRTERPELVRKMVEASVRGWEQYIKAPEETNQLIHRLNPEMGLDILEFGAKTLEPLVMDETSEQQGIGTMSRESWQTLANQLVDTEQMKPAEVHVDQAFTTEFLPPPR